MNCKKISIILAVLLLFAAFATFAALYLPHRLPTVKTDRITLSAHDPFRTWEEHGEIYESTSFPFVVEIQSNPGSLVFVGVKHSTDPDDPQFDQLRKKWDEFKPTVALNEGRSKYLRWGSALLPGTSDPKQIYDLAHRDAIPVYSIEPQYHDEVEALLEDWPADLVATYFSLRVITGEAGGDPARAEAIANGLIAKRTEVTGLRGAITAWNDLDRVWNQHLPDAPDWRTLRTLDSIDLMRQIGDSSREARGQHMVRAITTLTRQGERVFAVVGASHVIRYEPTLRSLLEKNVDNGTPTPSDTSR